MLHRYLLNRNDINVCIFLLYVLIVLKLCIFFLFFALCYSVYIYPCLLAF